MTNEEIFNWKRQVTSIQDIILQQLAGKENEKLVIIYTDKEKRDNETFVVVKKDQSFNFDIDNLKEAKNSNSEVMPYFKDFNEFDIWLNEEEEHRQIMMNTINKNSKLIKSNKDLRFKDNITEEQAADLHFNIYKDKEED